MSITLTPGPGLLDARIRQAVAVAEGNGVTLDVLSKRKVLRKFGRRSTLGTTRATLWEGNGLNEVYVSTNAITSIISSSASDGEQVTIEGHTVSGGVFTFVVQTATLNGQTAVTLGTALARVSRIANIDSTELAGNVRVYEGGAVTAGVPDDLTTVHALITAGQQQTQKAATTISDIDYWLLTEFNTAVLRNSSVRVDVRLEVRSAGGVFLPKFETGIASTGSNSTFISLDPVIEIPSNADVRATAISSAANSDVSAFFGGYLASVIG